MRHEPPCLRPHYSRLNCRRVYPFNGLGVQQSMAKSSQVKRIIPSIEFRPLEMESIMLPYTVALRQLTGPLKQPLSGVSVPVRKVKERVRQELEQHRDRIIESQSKIDQLLESARRHSEAQPALIHEPLEQAIDWLDDLQAKVGEQLAPNDVAKQSPWCGSVDKRLKGLAPVNPNKTPKSLQQNWQAMWQSQMAQTVSRYPGLSGLTQEDYRAIPQQISSLSESLVKMTGLPTQIKEARERVQRQVDRLIGVRPPDEIWDTQFPEDEDPPK